MDIKVTEEKINEENENEKEKEDIQEDQGFIERKFTAQSEGYLSENNKLIDFIK